MADRQLGTSFIVAIGVLAGMGLSFYVIWIRYLGPAAAGATAPPRPSASARPPTSAPTEEAS